MITDAVLAELASDAEVVQSLGLKQLSLPNERHQRITNAVKEVAARMKLEKVDVVVHQGAVEGTSYIPPLDILVISEKGTNLLIEDELKALISHELDHQTKRHIPLRNLQLFSILGNSNPPMERQLMKTWVRIWSYMELAGDRNAANLYGAENIKNALIKIFSNASSPAYGMAIMGDFSQPTKPTEIKVYPVEVIANKLSEIAAGEERLLPALGDLAKRLQYLHKRQ